MGHIHGDGFDYQNTAQILGNWTEIYGGGAASLDIGDFGRFGTPGLRIGGFANGVLSLGKTTIPLLSFFTGAAIRCSRFPAAGSYRNILSFMDNGVGQVELRVKSNGTLALASHGTVRGTSSYALSAGIYHYVEFGGEIQNSGAYSVRVDKVERISGTGDLDFTGSGEVNEVSLGTPKDLAPGDAGVDGGTMYVDYDDFFLYDAIGDTNNTFPNGLRVVTIFPDGPGQYSQLTLFHASGTFTQNWQAVRQAPSDDDQSYNHGLTTGLKDLYNFQNPTPFGVIKSVASNLRAKNVAGGAASIKSMYRHSGTDFSGPADGVASDYNINKTIWDKNPISGVAWTWDEVTNGQFGPQIG